MNYVVAVRALCEFTAKQGDLDLRFTPAPTALEGMASHAAVVARRGYDYEAEITLSGQYETLTVRGRADGFDEGLNQLEEVKSYRGDLSAMRENHRALHWAQARIYGHLLCEARGLTALKVALVYVDSISQEETVLVEAQTATALKEFFKAQCARFLSWAMAEQAHREARDEALASLPFTHATFRPGQRDLSVAVYRAARDGQCVMVQAPTGIGKTIGTIFPMLKASPGQKLDKIFFLAAKTPGRGLALSAFEKIRANAPGLPLRVLDLTAREKSCEHPDLECHGESCPLARGFYDRLPMARAQALESRQLDRTVVREAALAHDVCPYYLAQELVRWSDVVVADYNYYFDSSAMLYAMTQINQWRVALLVDEAHNLVDRARSMYSGTLAQADLKVARKAVDADLRKPFDSLARAWTKLNRAQADTYQAYDAIPAGLLKAAQSVVTAIAQALAQGPQDLDDAVLRFYFEALQFTRLAEQGGSHSLFDVTFTESASEGRQAAVSTLCMRNILPGPFLAPRYAAAHATVLFSGTLGPAPYYRDTLGLPAASAWVDVQAPFRSEQLNVHVAGHVSTRFKDRARSLAPIVDLIAAQYESRPGNYLGFFSSFDYLRQVTDLLRSRHPSLPIWMQTPGMTENERAAFLDRFTETSTGVGFAVLGGAFAEGVDLPGKRLIGAFVATLGLPQVNPVNEQIKLAMDARFGSEVGYDYTYLYPGLQKVVQAAGRVIRTESDTGTVHLIDDRFQRAKVRRLLPAWWHVN